jgi:hypothetical protein
MINDGGDGERRKGGRTRQAVVYRGPPAGLWPVAGTSLMVVDSVDFGWRAVENVQKPVVFPHQS